MGFDHFKRGYWNQTQEHNKKLIRKNGLENRLGILNFEFNRFLVSKNILLHRDLITQELIDEFKLGHGMESVKSETPIPEEFEILKTETEDLMAQFNLKQEKTREIIEKRFPSPQLTNEKFNTIIDSSERILTKRADRIMLMIKSADEYSPKIEGEIKSNITVLKQIIKKLDLITDELLVTMSADEKNEVDELLDEFEFLTASIKDYD